MASARQDMPPEGGYAPIFYNRVPHKRVFQNWMLVTGLVASTVYGYWIAKKNHRKLLKSRVEKYETLIALEPFLKAENDRAFLNQLRINRNYERDLMKNVPYWEVGTIWGEKIYKTIPKEYFPYVHIEDFYAHRPDFEKWQTMWPDSYI